MIQRLQTLWLLFAAALAFTTLKISFFSGNIMVENTKQFQRFTGMNHMLLMILTVVVGIGSLIAVFLYSNRKLQGKITAALMVLSIINLVFYYLQTNNFIPAEWSFDITALVAFAIPFFLFLAMRGIFKDEKLIKSIDRLR